MEMRGQIEVFSLDKRSLAAWRVLCGLIVLSDFFSRFQLNSDFFTDSSLVPRSLMWNASMDSPLQVVVWYGASEWFSSSVLFCLAFVCAICFTVGWKTRLSGWCLWVLLVGVQMRNHYVLHAGDVYLRCLLFFANFLPLSDFYSVDAGVMQFLLEQRKKCESSFQVGGSNKKQRDILVDGVAPAAFLFQVFCVYFFGSFLKSSDPRWSVTYTAGSDILEHVYMRSMFGGVLRYFPALVQIGTFLYVKWEFWCLLLLWMPVYTSKLRPFIAYSIIIVHLILGIFLNLDLLFWVPFSAGVALLPSSFWDSVISYVNARQRREFESITLHVDLRLWFPSRLLLAFYTFFLGDFVIMQFSHLDVDEGFSSAKNAANGWLQVTLKPGDVLRGSDALEVLCYISWCPLLWPIAYGIRMFSASLNRVGTLLSSARDFDSSLLYRKAPRGVSVSGLPSGIAVDPAAFAASAGSRVSPTSVVRTCVLLLLVWFVFMQNLSTLGVVSRPGPLFDSLGQIAALHQKWDMFATPPESYYWLKLRARLWSGQDSSLIEDGLERWTHHAWDGFEEPRRMKSHLGSYRWFKYMENAFLPGKPGVHTTFAKFLCTRWNAMYTNRDTLLSFEAFLIVQPLQNGITGMRRPHENPVSLFKHECIFSSKPTSQPTPFTNSLGGIPQIAPAGSPILLAGAPGSPSNPGPSSPIAPPPKLPTLVRPLSFAAVRPNVQKETMDRSSPWENIVKGVSVGKAIARGSGLKQGALLHALAEKWSARKNTTMIATTTKTTKVSETLATTAPSKVEGNLTLRSKGKWLMGKWVPNA